MDDNVGLVDYTPPERDVETRLPAQVQGKQNPAARTSALENTYAIVLDLALGVDDDAICDCYGLQQHQLNAIRADEIFSNHVRQVERELAKDGISFKVKARLMSEALLDHVWKVIHNPDTNVQSQVRLIEGVVRWAGYDAKDGVVGAGGGGFQLNIMLGDVVKDK